MAATGIAISFEHEITQWLDRDVRRIQAPTRASILSASDLDAAVKTRYPEFKTTAIVIPRDPSLAYEYRAGRSGMLYVNPYTGAVAKPESTNTHNFLHTLEEWHRWLGREGEGRATGKLITGVCNAAFLFMCLSGIYLWWPRSWKPGALRPAFLFIARLRGRARDFNWHHVFGSWSALVLIVIVTSGVVMSFQWANRLVFTLAGEQPPARGSGNPAVKVAPPAIGQAKLARDAMLSKVASLYPNWEFITFDSLDGSKDPLTASSVVVMEPAVFAMRGRTQLKLDPYRNEVLSKISFTDRSAGTRARTWLRFLHTGEALGMIGRIIATIAAAAALFLVYTGFALSWRRFFGRQATTK